MPCTDTTKKVYTNTSKSSQPPRISQPRKKQIKKSSSLKSLPNVDNKNHAEHENTLPIIISVSRVIIPFNSNHHINNNYTKTDRNKYTSLLAH